MGYPAPTATSGFHLVYYFNCGTVAGWDEEYYWAGDTSSFAAVEHDAALFAVARVEALSTQCLLLGVRIAPWPAEDSGAKLRVGAGFSGPGRAADDRASPLPPWVSVQVELQDATYLYRRHLQIRGLARPSIRWDTGAFTGLSPAGQGQIAPLLSILRNQPLPGWAMQGVWCIAGEAKDPAVTGEVPIADINGVAWPGCGTNIITSQPPPWHVGDLVRVMGLRGCNPKGLNGPARVLAVFVTGPTGTTATTITQNARCCGELRYTCGGRIKAISLALYAHATADAGRISKRDTGSIFVPMTWGPFWPMPAVIPVGAILDFLRHGYCALMTGTAGGTPVPVLWFPAPPGATVLQDQSQFRSRKYIHPYHDYHGIGEQMTVCWDDGRHQDVIPCVPACLCVPGGQTEGGPTPVEQPGGQREGGAPPLTTPGGQVEAGFAPTVPTGGQREAGMSGQIPVGGQAEAGLPSIYTGSGGVPLGGQTEGGAAPVLLAVGGETEGGPQPPLALGGETEGAVGTPPVPPGGETDGGPPPAPTVTVNCCADPVPQTLHITFSGGLSGTFTLTWDATSSSWLNTSAVLCGTAASTIALTCTFQGSWQWLLQVTQTVGGGTACSFNAGSTRAADAGVVCSPFRATWTGLSGDFGTCCAGLSVNATVVP